MTLPLVYEEISVIGEGKQAKAILYVSEEFRVSFKLFGFDEVNALFMSQFMVYDAQSRGSSHLESVWLTASAESTTREQATLWML